MYNRLLKYRNSKTANSIPYLKLFQSYPHFPKEIAFEKYKEGECCAKVMHGDWRKRCKGVKRALARRQRELSREIVRNGVKRTQKEQIRLRR